VSPAPPEDERTTPNSEEVPGLLKEAFDVFSRASQQLERSYAELKVRADRLAVELAQTNEELQRQLVEKERISNFLNNILESITSGIVVFAPGGEVALSNRAAEKMLGIPAGQAEGRPYRRLLGSGPIAEFVAECLSSGGDAPRSCEVELETRGAGEEKERGRFHFTLGFAPVLDSAGSQVGSLLVIQDITSIKALEEQALRSSRLAAMGEVAAELAHEIRNPLGSIEIFATLLSRDLGDPANRKLADNIVLGVKSLNAVVSNMLTFTRRIEINPEPLDINELVEETFSFMEELLKAQEIRLEMRLAHNLDVLEADSELLKQVLLNLAQNSIQAMGGGGTLTVSTAAAPAEESEAAVVVEVKDTGCGIDPRYLSRIFDPFFSTRKGGTGLGLSVASQIVGQHGGVIQADSEPGKGTRMRITLPRRPRQG
jgi:PAS domain S-box-containing protein